MNMLKRDLGISSATFMELLPSFVCLHLQVLRELNVLLEAVYCCFTRTTLFTTMFAMVIFYVH